MGAEVLDGALGEVGKRSFGQAFEEAEDGVRSGCDSAEGSGPVHAGLSFAGGGEDRGLGGGVGVAEEGEGGVAGGMEDEPCGRALAFGKRGEDAQVGGVVGVSEKSQCAARTHGACEGADIGAEGGGGGGVARADDAEQGGLEGFGDRTGLLGGFEE